MSDMTEACRTGYYGNPNVHLATSPLWYAHELGAWLHRNGYPIPTSGVRMGRGYSLRVGSGRFLVRELDGRADYITFEREA